MRSLKDHIQDQRAAFDHEEPNHGHAARFEQLMDKYQPESSRSERPMRMLWWGVAVVVAVILSVNLIPHGQGHSAEEQEIQQATIGLSDISTEMAEVESYFIGRIRSKRKVLQEEKDKASKTQLVQEQLARLEADYERLKMELTEHQGDERIVRYMVENYRLRLMLLETHLEKIEKFEQSNRLEKQP